MPKSALLGSTKVPTLTRDQGDTCAPDRRDRHGDRSVPPPLAFDIYALPDSTLLTSRDVAAHGRWAVSTVETWRQRPKHPLKWMSLPGGFVRTTVGDLKQFLASGKPRARPSPRAAPTEPPPASPRPNKPRKPSSRPRPRRRADRADAAELQEQT
jgi:hypothetical protein